MKKKKITSEKKERITFSTWDIETTNWNNFVIASLYDGKKVYFAYSPQETIECMKKIGGIFYAHFAGGFDNLFLLDALLEYDLRIKNIEGKLVRIAVYYKHSKKKIFELRDSYNILQGGLLRLQQSFDIKDELSQEKIKDYKSRRGNIEEFTKEELEEYVRSDSVTLHKILTMSLEIFDTKDFAFTIASASMKKFREMYDVDSLKIPSRYDTFFRKAYVGGRVEVFKRYGTKLTHYDFKSMYPFVMKQKTYPSGLPIFTRDFEEEYHGIYDCIVDAPDMHIPFLHYKDPKNKMLLFPKGRFFGTYTDIEIRKARALGYNIHIIKGYFFTQKVSPFAEYIDRFYKIKLQAEIDKKPALKYIAKLYLNTLYGKLGQRRTFTKLVQVQDTQHFQKLFETGMMQDYIEPLNLAVMIEGSKAHTTGVHVAAFVTAYARVTLYEAIEGIQKRGGDVYYCDTDCVITNIKMPIGKKLGDLDIEGRADEGYFLSPKLYTYRYNDKIVVKAKGFDTKQLKYNDYIKAYHGDMSGFDQSRESIAGILRGFRQHKKHLDVINTRKTLKGSFNKRKLIRDETTAIDIQELPEWSVL